MLSDEVLGRIKACRRVCVFTGAGISAESGIPTFRDSGGMWENYRVEDLVTPEAFSRDPVAVWKWHAWLQGLSFKAEPNAGHIAVAEMDRIYPEFLVVTQNIDNLHERAGTKRMIKLHGDIMQMRCLVKGHITRVDSQIDADAIIDRKSLPKCPECGGICRPDVVWFGEMLPMEPLASAHSFAADCDLFFIVGTSGLVSGGYGFAESAKRAGALIVEVNPQESALSYLADIAIRRPSAEALPWIVNNNSKL